MANQSPRRFSPYGDGFLIAIVIDPPLLHFSQTLRINIVDDEAYEKNKMFWVEMDEPRLLEMSRRKGGGVVYTYRQIACRQPPTQSSTFC